VHAGSGFDLDVWRFGEIALRFPRRLAAGAALDGERRALEWLAGKLPVAIPSVVGWSPAGDAEYPCPVLAVRWVAGEPSDAAEHVGATVATALGRVLRILHGLAPPPGVLVDQSAKSELERRSSRTADRLEALAPLLDAGRRALLREELGSPVPPPGPPVVAHTDEYPRHDLLKG
jgi:aminoglycoside phosphotransferase